MIGRVIRQLRNRVLQVAALYGPGAESVRPWLHRRRGVTIGDGAFIGTGVIVETEHPELVTIGANVTISVRAVLIAHFKGTYGVTVGDEVFIGPGAIVLPGVTIGKGAVVTAGSVVTRSVPPAVMVQGNPAKPVARCGVPLTADTSMKAFRAALRPILPPT